MITRSKSKRKIEENDNNKEKDGNVEVVLTRQDTFENIVEAAKADVAKEGNNTGKKRKHAETAVSMKPAPEERSLERNFSKESLDETYDNVKKRLEEEGRQKEESDKEDLSKKPAAIENGNGFATGFAALPQNSVLEQMGEPVEGSHVAALTRPQSVAKKYDIDLEGLYNFVLNGGDEKDLDFRQKIYHKGLMADSMEQVPKTAELSLNNDKGKMKDYVHYSKNEAKKEFEAGNIDKALVSIVDSRVMRAMLDYMEQGNDVLLPQATSARAI